MPSARSCRRRAPDLALAAATIALALSPLLSVPHAAAATSSTDGAVSLGEILEIVDRRPDGYIKRISDDHPNGVVVRAGEPLYAGDELDLIGVKVKLSICKISITRDAMAIPSQRVDVSAECPEHPNSPASGRTGGPDVGAAVASVTAPNGMPDVRDIALGASELLSFHGMNLYIGLSDMKPATRPPGIMSLAGLYLLDEHGFVIGQVSGFTKSSNGRAEQATVKVSLPGAIGALLDSSGPTVEATYSLDNLTVLEAPDGQLYLGPIPQ